MKLERCNNGHFYDVDKFPQCPHCQQVSSYDTDATESIYVEPAQQKQQASVFPEQKAMSDAPTPPYVAQSSPYDNYGREGDGMMNNKQEEFNNIVPGQNPVPQNIPASQRVGQVGGGLGEKVQNVSNSVPPSGMPGFMSGDDDVTVRFTYPANDKKVDPVVGWLVCIRGTNLGQSFIVKNGKNFIGRDISMDIVIPNDRAISRNCHAVIIYDPRGNVFLVEPGTARELFYLDDELVLTPQILKDHQVITLGETDLMFVSFCNDKFTWADQLKKNDL